MQTLLSVVLVLMLAYAHMLYLSRYGVGRAFRSLVLSGLAGLLGAGIALVAALPGMASASDWQAVAVVAQPLPSLAFEEGKGVVGISPYGTIRLSAPLPLCGLDKTFAGFSGAPDSAEDVLIRVLPDNPAEIQPPPPRLTGVQQVLPLELSSPQNQPIRGWVSYALYEDGQVWCTELRETPIIPQTGYAPTSWLTTFGLSPVLLAWLQPAAEGFLLAFIFATLGFVWMTTRSARRGAFQDLGKRP